MKSKSAAVFPSVFYIYLFKRIYLVYGFFYLLQLVLIFILPFKSYVYLYKEYLHI